MVASGPPAIINCELRQARKGATVAVDLCAGVWLEVPPPPQAISRFILIWFHIEFLVVHLHHVTLFYSLFVQKYAKGLGLP
jgi:hypothetical protein